MRDAAIALLVVVVGVLGYFLHSIDETLTNVERQMAKTAILEGQEKCAKQSAIVFKDRSLEAWPDAWYENHYNEKLNKCVVAIWAKDDTHKALSDAFEGRELGQFLWTSNKVAICDITLPSKEKKLCNSRAEFEQLVETYMP